MRRAADLQRLALIAGMLKDASLDDLRRASDSRNETLRALHELDGLAKATDAPSVPAPAITLHMSWAEQRRRALNTRLASETAVWLAAREHAARSVGRHHVLTTLAARPARRR